MGTLTPGPTRTYGATTTSFPLVALALGLMAVQLFVLPLRLLPHDAGWGWLLVPLALVNMPLWSLTHESIHGSLLRDRGWNDRLGRALAIAYGAPFALLKTGHLLHHRYSRTPKERTEVFDPATTTWWRQAPAYYVRLVGGLYLAEAASVLLLFAPRRGWLALARRAASPMTVTAELFHGVAARRLVAFRVDAALILAAHAAGFLAYGRYWWMLLAALAARALIVSVADNVYHYGTALDAPLEAMNLRLPRALEAFVLAFNLHGVHHRYPGLAWHSLRAAFRADGARFDLGWFTALRRQAAGPIPSTATRLLSPGGEPAADHARRGAGPIVTAGTPPGGSAVHLPVTGHRAT